MAKPLEIDIENEFVQIAEWDYGCLALKMKIPGRRNYPDRQILIGNGHTFFIEFKRFGEVPRRGQLSRHRKLRQRGYNVYICDNLKDALRKLEWELLMRG